MTEAAQAWPFAVARGFRSGFRTIVAPATLIEHGEQAKISAAVGLADSDDDRPTVTAIRTDHDGSVVIVSTSRTLVNGDVGCHIVEREAVSSDEGAPLLDEHGRVLKMIYGFVLPFASLGEVDDADLERCERAALAAINRFLDDESVDRVESAEPFELSTPTAPSTPSPRAPAPERPAGARPPDDGPPRRRPLPTLVGATAILAIAAWWLIGQPGSEALLEVTEQPSCADLTEARPECTIAVVSNHDSTIEVRTVVGPGPWKLLEGCPDRLAAGDRCRLVIEASGDEESEGTVEVGVVGSAEIQAVDLRYEPDGDE